MPLSSLQLDNTYPPIWLQSFSDGKSVGGVDVADLTPASDDNTYYRRLNGEDKQNYWTFQRHGGDLFHRDLVLAAELQRIVNYLGQRGGLTFSLPETIIAPQRHVVLSALGDIQSAVEDYTGFYVSSCRVSKTTDSGDCGIRIVSGASVIYTATAYGTPGDLNIFTTGALATASRGEDILLADGSGFQVQAYNEHASSNAVLSGFVVLSPKTS